MRASETVWANDLPLSSLARGQRRHDRYRGRHDAWCVPSGVARLLASGMVREAFASFREWPVRIGGGASTSSGTRIRQFCKAENAAALTRADVSTGAALLLACHAGPQFLDGVLVAAAAAVERPGGREPHAFVRVFPEGR